MRISLWTIRFWCTMKLMIPISNTRPEIVNNTTSKVNAFSTFNRLLRLKPAIKKYIDVRKNARKVLWFASVVRCKASLSRKIKSLLIVV